MENNTALSLSEKESSSFSTAFCILLTILRASFLPHILIGLLVFLCVLYVSYARLIGPSGYPDAIKSLFFLVCVILYGAIAFGLSFSAAIVYSLRRACVAWEEFLESVFDQVKENLTKRVEGMEQGLTKEQAKIAISGSVREVVSHFKADQLSSVSRRLAVFALGCITLAMRSVLIAKVVKYSGTTIRFSKLFAGKATLVGAVFLNLHFFSTLLLGGIYLSGIVLVWFNIWLVLKLS